MYKAGDFVSWGAENTWKKYFTKNGIFAQFIFCVFGTNDAYEHMYTFINI